MKLKLNKKVIENINLSNSAILAYVGILSCVRCNYDLVFVNRNMMSYYLTEKTKQIRRLDDNLKMGINELIDNNIIDCRESSSTNYYFGLKNIKLKDDDRFIFVDIDEVKKIMQSDYKGKIGLLRFYIVLLGTFLSKNNISDIRDPNKYNNVMGMMSQEYISSVAGVSSHTAVEYIKILEQLNIIYVYRCSFMFRDYDGSIKRHNNIYGRYKDKEIIDEFASVKYQMYDELHKVKHKNVVNNYRSLMQKYNCLVNGKEYNEKTIDDIFRYIVKYNNKNPNKEKDLTVFKKFGYAID